MNPLVELQSLLDLFPTPTLLIDHAEHVPAATTPEPYRSLLAHDYHMTVAMESFHHTTVDVRVLASRRNDKIYSRKIILLKHGTEEVVQFGIVRFNLSYVTDEVAQAILSEKIPLGRILIEHNVLRHIDLGALLKIQPGPELCNLFHSPSGTETYGRLATIFCNHRPAVDLLEISVPLPSETP